MTFTNLDHRHAREAVPLAAENAMAGERPFGAVLAIGPEVLATGVNTVIRDLDPTAHAEIEALRAAFRLEPDRRWRESVLYSSCEPCPMCIAVAQHMGVTRIAYAAPAELAAKYGFVLEPAALLMQHMWRRSSDMAIEHVDIENVDVPFENYRRESVR